MKGGSKLIDELAYDPSSHWLIFNGYLPSDDYENVFDLVLIAYFDSENTIERNF